MNDQEKVKVMTDTVQNLLGLIQTRMNNRLEALNALSGSPIDNLPDEVKKMREIEASKIRSVMQEQKDLIEIIKMLFPPTEIISTEKKDNKKK